MSSSNLPQLPDYFGFILGFLLIWLVYTGFSAVTGVFVRTHSTVIQYSDKAKEMTLESVSQIKKTTQDFIAVEKIERKLARARIKETKKEPVVKTTVVEKEDTKSWTTKQLKKANSFINGLILGIEDFVTEPEEVHHSASVTQQPRARKKSDSLEWFD